MQVIWTNRNGGVTKKVGGVSQTEVDRLLAEQKGKYEVEIIEINEAHAEEIVLIKAAHDEIVEDVKSISEKLKGKKVHAICVTHKSIALFQRYIKQGVQ